MRLFIIRLLILLGLLFPAYMPSSAFASGATMVGAGDFHTCAVVDGGVLCWGDNQYGEGGSGNQLANGVVTAIPSGSGVTAVAAGSYFTCAVVNGGVQCWGQNNDGQLGNGTYTNSAIPVTAIPPGSGATAIEAFGSFACAVVNGGVMCWGSNFEGQLGNGIIDPLTHYFLASKIPGSAIPAGSGAASVGAGYNNVCASVNGGVQCWGTDNTGILGPNFPGPGFQPDSTHFVDRSNIPVPVIPAGSGVTAVSEGNGFACAMINGGVKCWGGYPGAGAISSTPITVIAEGSGVTAISAAFAHVCVVVNGGVQCWGSNVGWNLGDGTQTNSVTPVQTIAAGSGATSVGGGLNQTCAVVNGGVQCWGGHGWWGPGSNSGWSPTPIPIISAPGTYTASGTYIWDSGTGALTITWTDSGFLCKGPDLVTDYEIGVTVKAYDMTWPNQSMTWSRPFPGGAWGDVAGTWNFSNGNSSYALTFDSATGTLSLTGNMASCVVTNTDTQAPAAPSNLKATINLSQVDLSWTDSTDNVGVTTYKVYRNGILLATLGNVTSYSDIGLMSPQNYNYSVVACDKANNCSALQLSTVYLTDIQAPSIPSGLTATAASSSQINLSWAASADNVGVTAYKIYRSGTLLTTLGKVTSYSDTGLTASTSYSYTVAACDAAGNCSAQSAVASTRTLASNQSISFGTAPSLTAGGTGTVSATATSGLAITFTSLTTGICTVSGSTVTGVAAGTCTIAADQAGNASYNTAPQVTQNITVQPAAKSNQTISFGTAPSLTVGGTGSVSATATSGLVVSFSSTTTSVCTVSGSTVTGVAAGTCTIAADQTGNASYNAAQQVTQSITVSGSVTDTTAPSVPTGLSATAASSSQINLSWSASTDNVGVTAYKVYRNGSFLAPSLIACQVQVDGAIGYVTGVPNTGYCTSSVLNIDVGGGTVTVAPATLLTGKTQVPWTSIAMCSPLGTPLSAGATTLTPCNNGGQPAAPTVSTGGAQASYSDTGLNAGTAYSYTVASCDAAGNCSAQSTAASATTSAAIINTGGATLNLVSGWNLLGNSVNASLTVATAFGNATNVTTVWKWIPTTSKWAFYTPSLADGGAAYAATKGYDFLTAINGGEGFWVNAKTAFTAQLPAGTAISTTYFQNQLLRGWNLISTGDNVTPSIFNQGLSLTPPQPGAIPSNITTLWAWDSTLSNWYFYAPSLEASGGLANYIASKNYLDFTQHNKTLGQGVGFWVNKP